MKEIGTHLACLHIRHYDLFQSKSEVEIVFTNFLTRIEDLILSIVNKKLPSSLKIYNLLFQSCIEAQSNQIDSKIFEPKIFIFEKTTELFQKSKGQIVCHSLNGKSFNYYFSDQDAVNQTIVKLVFDKEINIDINNFC